MNAHETRTAIAVIATGLFYLHTHIPWWFYTLSNDMHSIGQTIKFTIKAEYSDSQHQLRQANL